MPRLSPQLREGPERPVVIGPYVLFDEFASGGMATVHFARLLGAGASRTVAVKRLHPHFAKDPEFASMFLDEARLAVRVRHPNVISTLDVVARERELFLVMEYVPGEPLNRLLRTASEKGIRMDPSTVCAILSNALRGLHAAHEATSEIGTPLHIVHRDVSPQNILVGVDGVTRVLDFGVAKAAHRIQTTREGQVKGKISYMAPEQLRSEHVDRRTDVYAAGVVMWEALTGERLFDSANEGRQVTKILLEPIPEPRSVRPDAPEVLNAIVMRSLERDPAKRYATAQEMAAAIDEAMPATPAEEVGAMVRSLASEMLRERADRIAAIESISRVDLAKLASPEDEASGLRPAYVADDATLLDVPRSRSNSRRAYAAAALALAGIFGVWAIFARPSNAVDRAPSPEPSATASASPALTSSLTSTSTSATSPSATVASEPDSSLAPARSIPSATATATKSGSRALPSRGAASRSAKCNPPFVVDADGIRHLRRECM